MSKTGCKTKKVPKKSLYKDDTVIEKRKKSVPVQEPVLPTVFILLHDGLNIQTQSVRKTASKTKRGTLQERKAGLTKPKKPTTSQLSVLLRNRKCISKKRRCRARKGEKE